MSLSGIRLTNNRGWHFPSMKIVYMDDMILDDTTFGEFVSACPCLEDLNLGSCDGLTRIEVSGLVRLKRFLFYSLTQVCSVEVRAPSLEAFVYGGGDCFSHSEIKLGSCEGSLKKLSISNTFVSSEWLQGQISRFGDLEVLILQGIYGLTTLKISSPRLTKLVLECCENLAVDTEIYAPNLLDLTYSMNKFPYYSLVGSALPMKVDFNFWYPMNKYDNDHTLWSHKFEELLRATSRLNNVVVSIKFHKAKIGILHDGPSDSLLRILHSFMKLMPSLDIEVDISSSDANWKIKLITDSSTSIYVASSSLNNYLLEYLSENCGKTDVHRNLLSFRVESLNDWTEFRGDADTKLALLKAYNGSAFTFTRFGLHWH